MSWIGTPAPRRRLMVEPRGGEERCLWNNEAGRHGIQCHAQAAMTVHLFDARLAQRQCHRVEAAHNPPVSPKT